MSNKWDDKLTEKFLTLYRKHKCLWNPYSPNYKKCSVKNEAFQAVVKELNIPGIGIPECLQQIEVIKEKYKQEQIKAKKALKTGKLYNSKVPWFDLMSQMLCQVINDEENFGKNSIKYIPCVGTKNKQVEPRETIVEHGESNFDSQNDPGKFVKNGFEQNELNTLIQVQSRNNDSQEKLETIGQCPSCGWIKGHQRFQKYSKTSKDVNCKESGVQVEPKIKLPVEMCGKKFNETERKVSYRNNGTVPQSREDVALKTSKCAHCVPSNIGLEKNFTMYPRYVDDGNQSQLLTNLPSNFEVNETNRYTVQPTPNIVLYRDAFNWQTQKVPEFKDEIDGNNNMTSNRYNSYAQQFEENNSSFAMVSKEDNYQVSSRFKIIIPSSNKENEKLEITGYEVRMINPKLSNYILYQDSGAQKILINNAECVCKKELSIPNKCVGRNSEGYSSIIKLDIKNKRKDARAKKRAHTSEATVSSSDKINQTDKSYESEMIQTLKDVEKSELNPPKFVTDQECNTDVSLTNKIQYNYQDTRGAATSRKDETLIEKYQNQQRDESIGTKIPLYHTEQPRDEISSAAENFNNTRTLLNIVVKILERDDSHEIPENLQKTLNTMLDTFKKTSMVDPQFENNREALRNTSLSTQYKSLPPISRFRSTQTENLHLQESTNETEKPDKFSTNTRPQSPVLGINYSAKILGDETSMFLPPGVNNALNNDADKNNPNSINSNETSKSSTERGTVKEPTLPRFLDNANMSNFSSKPILDYTNEFGGDEPIASSSRKISEPRIASQLTRDFLEVVKYTLMMDQMQYLLENDAACCKQYNQSIDLQHSRK